MALSADTSATHDAGGAQRIDWRLCWLQAALYATTQTVFSTGEAIRFAIEAGEARDLPPLLAATLSHWLASGIALAAIAQWARVPAGRAWLVGGASVLTTSLVHGPAHQFILQIMTRSFFPETLVPVAPSLFLFWRGAVGGGLFFGYCVLVRRSRRRVRELAQVDIERTHLEGRVREARTAALERSVDPALLERSLAALRTTYARDIKAGEALLDLLVDFLRLAMPSIRDGSSVRADMATQRAWNLLRERLDNMSQADGPDRGTIRQPVTNPQGELQ